MIDNKDKELNRLNKRVNDLIVEKLKLKNNLEAMKASLGAYTETMDKVKKLEAETTEKDSIICNLRSDIRDLEDELDNEKEYRRSLVLANGKDIQRLEEENEALKAQNRKNIDTGTEGIFEADERIKELEAEREVAWTEVGKLRAENEALKKELDCWMKGTLKKENESLKKQVKEAYNQALDDNGILHGEDAKRFLKDSITPSTKEEKQFLKECDELYKKYPFGESRVRQEARQECIKEAIEEVLKLEKDIWEGRWFVGHISPFEVKELKDRLTESGKEKEE